MNEFERQKILTEARHFYLAAPVILPLLEKRRKYAYERLLAKHREGSTDYITLVSELAVLNDLEREITSKEQTYRMLEEQNGRTDKSRT